MNSIEETRRLMQETIDSEKDIEERRKYGQFSTPFVLAKEIVTYGLKLLSEKEISFLDIKTTKLIRKQGQSLKCA